MPYMARLSLHSPEEVLLGIGHRARELRLFRNLTQAELSKRADVGLRTLQRFETTGRVSMEVAVRVAFVLSAEDALEALFERPEPTTIDQVLAENRTGRKRARRSK